MRKPEIKDFQNNTDVSKKFKIRVVECGKIPQPDSETILNDMKQAMIETAFKRKKDDRERT